MEEQIKVRKSLIAKHRKETLFSKLNCTYIRMFWLLIYASIMSILLITTSEVQMDNYNFLHPQWVLTTRQVYWDSTLPICMILAETNSTIGNVNLNEMIAQLKLNHLNYVSQYNMADFNRLIIDYNKDLSEKFTDVYYRSLCRMLDSTELLN